jgi:Na+(H+)/acetate symporter ActP
LNFNNSTYYTYVRIVYFRRYPGKAVDTKNFYVAGNDIPVIAMELAIAADWMSAASFISMAGY